MLAQVLQLAYPRDVRRRGGGGCAGRGGGRGDHGSHLSHQEGAEERNDLRWSCAWLTRRGEGSRREESAGVLSGRELLRAGIQEARAGTLRGARRPARGSGSARSTRTATPGRSSARLASASR